MSTSDIIESIKFNLKQLTRVDLGYPLGDNVVRPASDADSKIKLEEPFAKWLAELYSVCDGLSLPDVHVGYFVKPAAKIKVPHRSTEPETLLLSGSELRVLPFGSTGGGDLFAVEATEGSVFILPPGPVKNGVYDGRGTKARKLTESISQFLELLLSDITAFVKSENQHVFLTKR